MSKYNKQSPGDTPGYVYLMACDDGRYKIGRTYLPGARETELHWQGYKVTLLWSLKCADMVTTERALHQRLAQYHNAGEWFFLPEEVVSWICSQTEASACEGYDPVNYRRPDAKGYRVR